MKARAAGYRTGALAMVANSGFSSAAGLISLWLLNQILSKDMFGAYMVAMNAVFLVAIVATLGLDRALLLRISGLGSGPGVMRGSGLALRAAFAVAVMAGLIAILLALSTDVIVRAGAMPELAQWLPVLAVAVLPIALTALVQGWFQANHRGSHSVLLPGIADMARAAFIGLAFAFSAGAIGVAAAAVLGACLPLAVALVWILQSPRRRSPRRLVLRDFLNGQLFMLQSLTVQGMRYIDLLVLGLLATGSVTADYAVAVRLALAVDLGRIALKPTFTPRVRRHLSRGDHAVLAQEYHALRLGSFLFALIVAGILAVFGPWFLGLFGAYDGAFGPLLVIAATHVLISGCGMYQSYLSMSGEVGWSASIRLVSMAVLVGLIVLLAPRHGALGTAFAVMAVEGAIVALSLRVLWLRQRFAAVPFGAAIRIALAVGLLIAGTLGVLAPPLVGLSLLLCAVIAAMAERSSVRTLLRLLRQPKTELA